jgi:Uncharacterised nucleotidyltransferase
MSTALLLECIRAQPDLDKIRSAVLSGVNWETALDQASRHFMAPLLYWCLSRACPGDVPAPVLETLRGRASACAGRSLWFTAEMFRVLDGLNAQGVRAIPFKGPVIAWCLYESPGLREMIDLDLLVAQADIGAARKALIGLGYEPSSEPEELKFYPISEMHFSRVNGMQIDLHWRLAPPPFASWFDSGAVRARAVTVEIARREVTTISPRDLLRFLCMHAAKHGWISLRDVSDIARLMRSDVDYAAGLADAEAYGGMRAFLLGLALARDLAGAELPAIVSDRVDSESGLAALMAAAKENLVHSPELGISGMLRWHWRLLNRPMDRVRLLWGFFLPNSLDREWMPGLPYAAYFAVKGLRLAVKYASFVARGRLFTFKR